MTNRSYTETILDPGYSNEQVKKRVLSIASGNSPRVNGKLAFRQNTLNYHRFDGDYERIIKRIQGDRPSHNYPEGSPPTYEYLTSAHWLGGLDYFYHTYDTALYNAQRKFYAELYSVSTNLAELYATRKETERLVIANMKRIANAYLFLRRGDYASCLRSLGAEIRRPRSNRPTQAWLEYVYAWEPLVKDVYGLLNVEFKEPYRIIKARGRDGGSFQRNSPIGQTLRHRGTVNWKSTVVVRAKAVCSGTALQPASELGLTNPALLGWELLPFSFVVDWFVPIGPYLETMMGLPTNLTLSDASTTISSTSEYTGYCDFYNTSSDPGTPGFATGGGNFRQIDKIKTRSLTIPSREFPRLRNPLSPTHFANAMSLLVQAFHGRH